MSSPDSNPTVSAPSTAAATTGATGPQSLARSLQVLNELLACAEPVSATQLAERVGLHQSSVSRILSTWQAVGFVRKPDYHHFAADYGLLTFAAQAIHQFPLIQQTLPVLRRLIPDCGPMLLTVATLWRGEMIYLVRYHAHGDPSIMPMTRFPLHLSSPALRMLLDLPVDEALDLLEHSRQTRGWERPGIDLPVESAALLKRARSQLAMDVLALDQWQRPDIISAAIPLRIGAGAAPAALSLSGENTALPLDRIRALLQQGAREIESAFRQDAKPAEKTK